jgi:hypothetical protein
MAVPASPTNLANGAVLTEAWVDSVRDWVVFDRGTRPLLKVVCSFDLASAVETLVPFNASGDWNNSGGVTTTVPVNRGTWVPAVSGSGIPVPETGVYRLSATGEFAGDTTPSQRYLHLQDDATDITGGMVRVGGYESAAASTGLSVSTLRFFTAGDEVNMNVYQNAGDFLTSTFVLTAEWLGSTA